MRNQLFQKVAMGALLALVAVTACKPKGDEPSKDEAASTATAEGEKPKTPCDELSAKLCAEVGENSATCKGATENFALLSDAACKAGIKDFATTQTKLEELTKDCDKLIETLCAGVGPDTASCKMVREKTKSFPPQQCTQMLKESDKIIAQLKAEELKNQPLTPEQQQLIATPGAPSHGPETAKVTVVEFSDFECPYCSRAASVTTQLKEKYGDRVRIVFRQFPLSFHKNAQAAAEASLAAHAQGKFWEFHDLMFENQKALTPEDLNDYAEKAGLDVAQFKKDMESNKYADDVKRDVEMGGKVAVSGTPSLFVNGARVSNPTDLSVVSQEIDKALGS